ncbi:hypothetical protein JZ751_007745 [Albula glossodonta]|uniref:Uncharacterized protein n=1 Tax=Albula glossodonta TaxID=121402 RepID=A0A8T2P3P1_9TELE|nr:hypothetical protein JZ751_007745 [Albula glossodonta]
MNADFQALEDIVERWRWGRATADRSQRDIDQPFNKPSPLSSDMVSIVPGPRLRGQMIGLKPPSVKELSWTNDSLGTPSLGAQLVTDRVKLLAD